MRLARFEQDGPRVGVVTPAGVRDVTALADGCPGTGSPMRRLIASFSGVRHALEDRVGRGDLFPLDQLRLLTPVPDPSKVVAAPVNYRAHMDEMHQDSHIDALGVFLKAPSSLLDPGGMVRLPYHDRRFDQEGELAVVIGAEATRVPEERALDHVLGYTCLLDVTMRGGEDRSTRKSFDTFTPCGPYLVTADEVGPSEQLALRCWVNGGLRQEASTGDLIWGVARLVAYVSSVMTLLPGDIVSTGTPEGVGPLAEGDRV
ncbi:MAG TPA: fumarylacetoacetate hydrolase family protein, partial [Acidimicrobiales bacterium]|nr:fumarylacetoacetate hydrolase family protein [Acidimicrobiales bacterium]